MRNYQTKATMLIDPLARYTGISVISPDERLVEQLHKLLDMIPDENHALMIDHTVAEIIRFRNPNRQRLPELEQPHDTDQ